MRLKWFGNEMSGLRMRLKQLGNTTKKSENEIKVV